VFEYRTKDSGKAEERVFQKLNHYRRGKWGQEYFEVALEKAKETIVDVCTVVDSETEQYLPPPNSIQVSDFSKAKFDSKYVPITNAPPIVTSSISREPVTRTPRVRWFWPAVAVIITIWFIVGTNNKSSPFRNESEKPLHIATTVPSHVSSYKELLSKSPNNGSQAEVKSTADETSHPPNASNSLNANNSAPGVAIPNLESTERGAKVQLNMSELTRDEQTSIESVCSEAKYLRGPVAYNQCISKQLASLKGTSRNLDMSGLTRYEQTFIESVCSEAKYLRGPVAYNQCIGKQLASLKAQLRH
jgi:hypothetical protein